MFRAVIFDMDDTLIKTREAKFEAHKHTGKKFYNLDFTDEYLSSHWGKPFKRMLVDTYQNVDTYENLLSNYRSVSVKHPISPYDGAVELVAKLTKSHSLGLLTAANEELTVAALAESGIDATHFHYLQTSDDTVHHKPDPRVFSPILEYFGQLGIDRTEILYVGDKLDDMQASRGAGIEFLAVADHTTPAIEFVQAGAKYITEFSKLTAYLS